MRIGRPQPAASFISTGRMKPTNTRGPLPRPRTSPSTPNAAVQVRRTAPARATIAFLESHRPDGP